MNDVICFSDNREDVKTAFKDYMNQYLSEVEGRKGLIYDNTIAFSEKEKKMNKIMVKEIYNLANVNCSDDGVSMQMFAQHPVVRWASFAVYTSLVDMVLPELLDDYIGGYSEIKTGDYGSSFNFEIEPNDLFYVSKAGRNQRTVEFQKQYKGQKTIVPQNREISVSVNVYAVLCGKESLAKSVMKAALSIRAQMAKDTYIAFNTAMAELPKTPETAALKVANWTRKSAIKLAQTVTAWNNSPAIFLGTALALSDILPEDRTNYSFNLDSDYMKVGYVSTAFGYRTMVLPQVADYKNPYGLVLDDKVIYVMSPGMGKPVKVCMEGSLHTRSLAALDTADLTDSTTLELSYGIGIVTNEIAGMITLAADTGHEG